MQGSSGEQTGTQSALTGPQGAKQTKDPDGVEYVVQKYLEESSPSQAEWRDIASVSVPARSQTRTIVIAGVKKAGIKPDASDRFRVLDTRAARELQLTPKAQPEPEYDVSVVTGSGLEASTEALED